MYYLLRIDTGVSKACATKANAATELSKTPTDERDNFAIAGKAEDLAVMSIKVLTEVFNACQEENGTKLSKLKDKSDANLGRVWDALEETHNPKKVEAAKVAAAKEAAAAKKDSAKVTPKAKANKAAEGAPRVPREGSKMGALYAALAASKKGVAFEDLMEASGFDEPNTRTAIGVLRGRNFIPVNYDREAKLYSLGA